MKVRGHVEGNVVIIDDDVTLPEGEEVTVETKEKADASLEAILRFARNNRVTIEEGIEIPSREERNARR